MLTLTVTPDMPPIDWRADFVLRRECMTAAERARLHRAANAGELVRVRAGVYMRASRWAELDHDSRFLTRMRAAVLSHPDEQMVFGGLSAAAIWGLPIVGAWPTVPEIIADAAPGGRSLPHLTRRCEGIPEHVWSVDGLCVSGLARTVIDVARMASFETAVSMSDRSLSKVRGEDVGARAIRISSADLESEAALLGTGRGSARVRAVVEFTDGLAESAGESVSRIGIRRLGFPPPVLQKEFRDSQGKMFPDFYWPEFDAAAEFDGRGKYLKDEYTLGKSTAQVVIEEKGRENRLRALVSGFGRWDWPVARSLPALREHLLVVGVRPLARAGKSYGRA
jgi:hypothetical protein